MRRNWNERRPRRGRRRRRRRRPRNAKHGGGPALATALLALLAVGAGGGLLIQHEAAKRQEDQARRDTEQRQNVEFALEKASGLRQQARWGEAKAVLEQARRVLGDAGSDDLRQRLDVADAELALVNRLDAIRQRRETMIIESKFDLRTTERDYAAAFREADLGEVGDDEIAVAARVRASGVSAQLVAALDDWATVAEKPELKSWLLGVARRAAPDAWGTVSAIWPFGTISGSCRRWPTTPCGTTEPSWISCLRKCWYRWGCCCGWAVLMRCRYCVQRSAAIQTTSG